MTDYWSYFSILLAFLHIILLVSIFSLFILKNDRSVWLLTRSEAFENFNRSLFTNPFWCEDYLILLESEIGLIEKYSVSNELLSLLDCFISSWCTFLIFCCSYLFCVSFWLFYIVSWRSFLFYIFNLSTVYNNWAFSSNKLLTIF